MKNFIFITIPLCIIVFLIFENIFNAQPKKPNLMELTGRKQAVNTMLNWAKNEPYFAYSPRLDIDSLDGKYINNYGFISTPDIELEKDSNTVRIAFLGESSTAGTGKNLIDKETWPWKVIELLKNKGYKVDFINAACGGYTTFDSYGILWSKVRFFNPDIVIVNHGWNDFGYFHQKEVDLINFRKNEKKNFEGVEFKGYFESYQPLFIDPLIQWSQTLTRLRLIAFNKPGKGEIIFEEEYDLIKANEIGGSKVFYENMLLINEFCKTYEISTFFCKQPTLITNEDVDFSENQEQYRIEFIQQRKKDFDLIYEKIDTVANKNKVIDLRKLSGIEANFWDHIHPSPKGTDEIARIVADSLINNYFTKQ